MISEAIKKEIRAVVGDDYALDGEVDLFGYSYDSSFVPLVPANTPDLVVRPLTTGQVSAVMAIACRHEIPVTPRGAASGRTGGSVPLKGGISLSLERMTNIVELDEKNMMVTAEAGVRTIDLYNHCAASNLFFPPDPASWKMSTVGGNVAENAGGMRAVKYGVTGDYVMGLEVVLADGTVLNTGGKAIKNVTGYDLTSLFVGSEGTLGVVTRALFKLIPMPKTRGTIQIMFKSLDDGCETINTLLQRNIVPAAAEIMDKTSLDAVARKRNMELDPAVESCVIIETDGEDQAALDTLAGRIEAVARECRAVSFRVAQSQAESDELWAIRRTMSSAVASLAPSRLGEDISVPRAAFPEVVKRIKEISAKHGLIIAVFGHAGDGNLHPSILCDLEDPADAERAHHAADDIFAAALAVGGTLSGEHGIGITKKPYIYQAMGEAGVKAMQSVKQALDPKGILNPGKIW
jgi:glycolate oxidase